MKKIIKKVIFENIKNNFSTVKNVKNTKFFKYSLFTTGFVLFSTFLNSQFNALEEEEKVQGYVFKTDKLKQASPNKKAYVLVACGSFNPPTIVNIIFNNKLHTILLGKINNNNRAWERLC